MKSHIQLSPSPNNSRVIVCGSPERAKFISERLESPHLVAMNREYHSYFGTYDQCGILVTSHGIGSAGAAICFQELIDVGAKAIIRVGTAGGLYDEKQIGDIVVPTAAIRRDGVSALMIPPQYPAVPSFEMTGSLLNALEQQSTSHRRGIVLTSDLFYPGLLDTELNLFKNANALAVEMECSTLFVIGAMRNVKTAAALVLDGNPLKWADGQYDPDPKRLQGSIEACVKAALSTLAKTEIQQ